MGNIAEKLLKITQMAREDRNFRAKLIENPKEVLASFGIRVTDEKPLIIEYHDNYGLFIGLPMTSDKAINVPEGDTQHRTFTDQHFMECLHY
ncbi:MAG TPA: hypothetical protein VLB01_08540 [Thermodesulfobacteriota bacterium]|nr:hypothetical protein [Thermodesulfobacteriota bacterium]